MLLSSCSYSSLLVVAFLLLLLCLCFPEIAAQNASSDAAVPWQTRLSLAPRGQLSLHWLSRAAEPEAVEISEWGATGIVQRITAVQEHSEALDGVHSRFALLPALRPGGSYLYRLPELRAVPFRAPTQDQSPVSVLLLADMGTWGTVLDVVKALGRALEGDLVFHLGDLSYAQDTATWDKWAEITSSVLPSRPWMFIPGNWDAKPFAWPTFLQRFYSPLLPSPERYHYTFTYQKLRFIMLNSYEAINEGSEQYNWLTEQLRAADTAAQRKQHPWVIVCFHSPMYSSSTGHGGGDEAFRRALEPLFVAYHVDLCFTGHDHGYERSYPVRDGEPLPHARGPVFSAPLGAPIHLLVGTAGATHDPWMDAQPAWSAVRESAFGYTRLRSFANDTLVVELVRTDDTVGDRFMLVRRPAAGGDLVADAAASSDAAAWHGFLPSGPFLALLLIGFALPSAVVLRHLSGGRHSSPLMAFIPSQLRRSGSSFLLQSQQRLS